MASTLAQLRAAILLTLQKTAGYQGQYTSDKVDQAINESKDYVSSRMFLEGEGWGQKIGYIDLVAGTPQYALPAGLVLIDTVRVLIGNIYEFIPYDEQSQDDFMPETTDGEQYPSSFRLLESNMYFNPVPLTTQLKGIQFEYVEFPADLLVPGDTLSTQFNNAFKWYIVYRACGILVGQNGKANPSWGLYESQWYNIMENFVSKRVRQVQTMRDFR